MGIKSSTRVLSQFYQEVIFAGYAVNSHKKSGPGRFFIFVLSQVFLQSNRKNLSWFRSFACRL